MSQPEDDGGLDRALAHTGDAAFLVDADGRIALWNRAAEKLLGYVGAEVIGRASCEIFVGRNRGGERLCYRGCHGASGASVMDLVRTFDLETRTKDGRVIWLNVNTMPWPDGDMGAMSIHLFRDITPLKALLGTTDHRSAVASAALALNGAAGLTRRELEVLRLLSAGANTRLAAERLHLSPATVRNHVQSILAKLSVHSRLEAVAHAARHRLL
jgi:PAS domain S-box-containing protein